MQFLDLVKSRRACHTFDANFVIDPQIWEDLFEYVRFTPSGYNRQPWNFHIFQSLEAKQTLQHIAFDQEHVSQASAVIVAVGDMNMGRDVDELLDDWQQFGYITSDERAAYHNSIAKKRSPEKLRDMLLRNVSLACMTLMFAAKDLGLDTCPMMGFSAWKLEEFLRLDLDYIPIMMILIGKSDAQRSHLPQLPRKHMRDFVVFHDSSSG